MSCSRVSQQLDNIRHRADIELLILTEPPMGYELGDTAPMNRITLRATAKDGLLDRRPSGDCTHAKTYQASVVGTN
jgi:hypothetical protein